VDHGPPYLSSKSRQTAMTAPPRIIEFVSSVVEDLRRMTPRETIEFGVLHGFCLDEAQRRKHMLIEFLTSAGGLAALSAALSQMPDQLLRFCTKPYEPPGSPRFV
jgi:hypothetical protein